MNDSKFLSLNGLTYYDGKLKNHLKELYGTDMTVEWEEIKDGKNPFKLKIALKNGNGTELFAKTVDFPLEQTIVSGSYENATKSLILYFQDGTSTKIPIKDLIEGLASKLDLESKASLSNKVTDSSVAYIKSVPTSSASYAKISTLGGISYKSVNIWDEQWEIGFIQTGNGQNASSVVRIRSKNHFRCLPNTQYYISGITDGDIIMYEYGADKSFIQVTYLYKNKFTTAENTRYLRFVLNASYGTTYKNNICINVSDEKYNGKYYPYFEGLRDTKVTAVKSVGANVLNIEGENFIKDGARDENGWFLTSNNGLTIQSYWDGGQYTFTSKNNYLNITAYNNSGYLWLSRFVKLQPNTTYRVTSSITREIVGLNDKTTGTVGTKISVTNGVFNSGNYKYWMISFYNKGSSNVMINKGEEERPFSPYTEHTLAIPEPLISKEWYGIGIPNTNVYNTADLENGNGDIKAGIVDLGTLNWELENNLYWISKSIIDIKYVSNNTEIGNALWGNGIVRMASGMSTSVSGELAIDTTRIACNNGSLTEKPTGLFVYELATPETEDISNLITGDNLIGVEGGGTVTLVNEYEYDIPCDIDFFTGDNKIVGSRVFVGDLMGRASFAKYFDVDGSPSKKTIAEALEDVTREDSPIKVTSTSIGQKATEGLELTVSTDVLANPPAEIGDIVIDVYTDAENLSYINLWEITGFDAGYSTMRIVGINSVNTGGGSASFSQKAEADGNGNNIAGTYATKQALKALEDSANGSIHSIEAAIDGVEANGQALAERLDSLSIVNGAVAKAVTATNAESAKAGGELDISIRDASVNASDALTKATNALASAAENHTIIQNFPNTYAKISDLSDYSLLTESGNSVSVSWEPPVNGVNPYKLNIKLINAKGNEISSAQIDFPLEQMVVGAEYTESTKELILETLDGTVKVPVSDIFRGLITESNIGNQTVAKANLATKATNDGQGNDIVQTYATNSNLSALENRVDNLDSSGQALAERLDSLSIVNGTVAKAVTAINAESAKAGSGLDADITQAKKDASDALANANSVLSLVNENKTQLEAIFNEDAPATVQKAKYAETAGSADYASRCRDSNGNPLLISNIVTKADAAELLASQANSASKSAIVSARCEYIKSSYQASVGTLNLYLKTADNREIAVTDFQEALISLLEDFMS